MSLILGHHFLLHLFQMISVCTIMSKCPRRLRMSVLVNPKAFYLSMFFWLCRIRDYVPLPSPHTCFFWLWWLCTFSGPFSWFLFLVPSYSFPISFLLPSLPCPSFLLLSPLLKNKWSSRLTLQPSFLHIFTLLFKLVLCHNLNCILSVSQFCVSNGLQNLSSCISHK